ncbi:hypothetical protein Plhal304r1_c090g0171431 [Plasmopara halstedii]
MRGSGIISTIAVLIAMQAHGVSSTLSRKLEAMRENEDGKILRGEGGNKAGKNAHVGKTRASTMEWPKMAHRKRQYKFRLLVGRDESC